MDLSQNDIYVPKKKAKNEEKGNQNLKPKILETNFRSVFSNLEGDQPDFL